MIDKALRNILKLPHISNAGRAGHEKAVEQELVKCGFRKGTISEFGLTKKEIKICAVNKRIAPNTYVWQPCGSQSFPDFIVSDANGTIHYIECKSSKDDKITWNSGKPKENAIYVHSSGKHNKQSIIMGSDLWTDEEIKVLKEWHDKSRALEKKYKNKLKELDSNRSPYFRPMYNDNDKIAGNPDRGERIKRVFDFLAEVRDAK